MVVFVGLDILAPAAGKLSSLCLSYHLESKLSMVVFVGLDILAPAAGRLSSLCLSYHHESKLSMVFKTNP